MAAAPRPSAVAAWLRRLGALTARLLAVGSVRRGGSVAPAPATERGDGPPEHWRRLVGNRTIHIGRTATPAPRQLSAAAPPPTYVDDPGVTAPARTAAERTGGVTEPGGDLPAAGRPTWPVEARRAAPGPPSYPELDLADRSGRPKWPALPAAGPAEPPRAGARFPVLPDQSGATGQGRPAWPWSDSEPGSWPALPDDGPLWNVASPAYVEEQIRRLEEEQRGMPWNG